MSAAPVVEFEHATADYRSIRRLRAAGHEIERGGHLALIVRASAGPHAGLRARSLLQIAGFLVEAVEPCELGGTRLLAKRVCDPPESFAAEAWGAERPNTRLDLRYAPEETEWLDPRPHGWWSRAVASTQGAGFGLVSHYPVDDPFCAIRAAGAIGRAFGCSLDQRQVTFGAGVTSLLHDLCALSDGGPIACPPLVHADLEARAFSKGIPIRVVAEPSRPDALIREIVADPPALLHLDRPTFTGEMMDLAAVAAVAEAAAQVGAPVVIDEAGATYFHAAESAVSLVNRSRNLVVLRGFTKAYSWGGLRAGFAVASPDVSAAVRAAVTPMQVSEAALAAVLRLLEAEDCLAGLRLRIRSRRAETASLLASSGLEPIPGHPDLPWIALGDQDHVASTYFAACGIRPLRPTSHPCIAPVPPAIRITIPLSDDRFERLVTLLADGRRNGARN